MITADELRSLINTDEYSPIQLKIAIRRIEEQLTNAALNGKHSYTFITGEMKTKLSYKIVEELINKKYKLIIDYKNDEWFITVEW